MVEDGPGAIIDGRFKILSPLGEGGMGMVFRALHEEMDRPVAIKLLKASLSHAPEQQLRFRKEAQLISSLKHPNIVSIYSVGVSANGAPYIAMELLDGRPLSDVIQDTGGLPFKEAVPLFIQACAGLEHAHQNGIIHGDIKPSNLMLVNAPAEAGGGSPGGASGGTIVKVVDFGIAKALDGDSITQTNAVMGSAFYLSPGLCEGRLADPQSDIYSLGCSLFETLTGHPPFVGDTYLGTLQMHRTESTPRLSDLCDDKDSVAKNSLQAIIDCCLEKDAVDRYKSVADLRHDLQNVLNGKRPELIPVPSQDSRAARHERRSSRPSKKTWMMLTATVCGVVLAAAFVFVGMPMMPSRTDKGPDPMMDIEGERAHIRKLIVDAHTFNSEDRYAEARPPLEEASARAIRIGDPLLEGSSAVELRRTLSNLAQQKGRPHQNGFDEVAGVESEWKNTDERTSAMLNSAIEHIERAMDSGKLSDKSLAFDQIFKCACSLVLFENDPAKSAAAGEKAWDAYKKGLRRGDDRAMVLFILTSTVHQYLRLGETEKAVDFAKIRRDFQVHENFELAKIQKTLSGDADFALSLENEDAADELRALIPR